MAKKKKKAQEKILSEIKNQLTVKAKKLGIDEQFAGVNFEVMKYDAAKRILDDLNNEKTHLEYELYMKGTLDKESTIKLEKINTYINKAQRVIDRYGQVIEKSGAKKAQMQEKGRQAAEKMVETPKINISR